MFFHKLVAAFDGDFGGFNENDTYSDWELGDSDHKKELDSHCAPEKSTDFVQILQKYPAYSASS